MNTSRIGLILLIIGLILLLNSWSSHVPNYATYGHGEAQVNKTLTYNVFIAPVGIGNITVGYNKDPTYSFILPPGMNETVVLPIHLLVQSPTNETLLEMDTTTPCSHQIDFNLRGEYTVYLTNKGTKPMSIPIGLVFLETKGNSNRESDKYSISIILAIFGVTLVCIDLLTNFLKKGYKL